MANENILSRGSAVLALVLAVLVIGGEAQSRPCPAGVPCRNIAQCRPMLDLLRTRTPEAIAKIRENICDISRRRLSVCCKEEDPFTGNGEDLLPKDCPSTASNRIIEGEEIPLKSMPFLALLGFSRGSGGQVYYACGGALINDRYVLTAAHCLHRDFNQGLNLARVVLGEHDQTTSPDCKKLRNGQEVCSPKEQVFTSFPRSSIIIHENFTLRNALSDDIALIRLERPAEMTEGAVLPICLPAANQEAGAFLNGRNATAAGWGLTTSPDSGNAQLSTVPLGVELPFVARSTCDPFINRYTLIDGQICFGGSGRRDTCDGDSGGPVIGSRATGPPFYLMGLTSGGANPNECGTAGIPAVYTDVAYYRSWIASKLRP